MVARDDAFNSGTLEVTVTVTDVNEGPEVTGRTSFTISENQNLVGATYTATDPEDPGAAITLWGLTGRDAGDFAIDEGGQLTFRSVPDYERPADSGRDNVYEVTVRASDGRYYGYLEATVTVTDVNEAPAVTTHRHVHLPRERHRQPARLPRHRPRTVSHHLVAVGHRRRRLRHQRDRRTHLRQPPEL